MKVWCWFWSKNTNFHYRYVQLCVQLDVQVYVQLPSGPIEYLSKSNEACSQVGLKLLEGTSNGHLQGLQSPGVCLNGLP